MVDLALREQAKIPEQKQVKYGHECIGPAKWLVLILSEDLG